MKTWTPEEIKTFRKRHNLYQKELSKLLGVTERYVIYLEKGVRTPSETVKLLFNCLERELSRIRKEVKKRGDGRLQKG
jgi:transcriptional regulator with XRE-family HTH domain